VRWVCVLYCALLRFGLVLLRVLVLLDYLCWCAMMLCVFCVNFCCLTCCSCFTVVFVEWSVGGRVLCVSQIWVRVKCVCVSDMGLCEMFVCVAIVVWFPFCEDECGGLAGVFCECVVVLVDSCSVLFRLVLAFELTGCCAFLCWVVLLLVRLLARFHCVVVGVGFSWMWCCYFGVQVVGQVARVWIGPVFCGFSYSRLC